jgi:hypothetical protein
MGDDSNASWKDTLRWVLGVRHASRIALG